MPRLPYALTKHRLLSPEGAEEASIWATTPIRLFAPKWAMEFSPGF